MVEPSSAISLAVAAHIQTNILVVDDRRENLVATEKILRHLDARIFKASSGNEALSLMLRHHFAVVLLDVQMPEMDGFETALLMREQENMQNVPIIFVTAISKEEKYATQAAEIGAVDYIFKPINADILRSKVKVYLDLYVQREQILKLNDNLRQYNEELERFAYSCSHDLQEPVRMMNSYADLLSKEQAAQLDGDSKMYLDFIVNSAHHMKKMICDILVFSRVGREELECEKVDCNQVMSEILEEFKPIVAEKQAQIICGDLPVLESYTTLLRVLFQNLISNALKFQDGSKPPEINIQATSYEKEWRFTVRDNGIGIAPEFSSKVFAIFQRIHRKEEYPGTGIGLSTCKKFVELCGGKIGFTSTPGLGTEFFFTLPQSD
jgi:signal transduction histidine kinase